MYWLRRDKVNPLFGNISLITYSLGLHGPKRDIRAFKFLYK